jgi:chemotaxis protein methyltransferase CheR
MNHDTYEGFRRLISSSVGIELGPERKELLSLRVRRRMRQLNIQEFDSYLLHVLADDSGTEIRHLQDAVTTNYTFFYREAEHLAALRQLILAQVQSGQRRFRVWSAGCSTGEEPYSIAMVILDVFSQFPEATFDLAILAVDVSNRVLMFARRGEYSSESIKFVPPEMVDRFFESIATDSESGHRVSSQLRQVVHFRRLNLSEPPFPMRGQFDAIFCRNVLIYFDHDARRRLMQQFESLLSPGGLLFVGMTESAIRLMDDLDPLEPSVYRKRAADGLPVSVADAPCAAGGAQ